jgi:hypothetical protein
MNFIQSIINQNTIVSEVVSAPASQNGATEVYVSLGPWPRSSFVERIIISANNNISSLTATVLTDAALYRAASSANKPLYIAGSATGNMANNMLVLDLAECFVEDARNAGVLHLRLSASSITTGTVFTVRVEGKRGFPTSYERADGTGIAGDRSLRILHGDSGGTVTDITRALIGNGGKNLSLNNPNDYVYVGSAKRRDKWLFELITASTDTNSTLTAEVWNGSAWVAADTVLDNTSDGMAAPGSFRYNGVIAITASAWVPTQVTGDPLNNLIDDVQDGTTQPPTLLSNPDRFWVRFKVNITTGEVKFASIRPLA